MMILFINQCKGTKKTCISDNILINLEK